MIYTPHTWRTSGTNGSGASWTQTHYGRTGFKSRRSYAGEPWDPKPLPYSNFFYRGYAEVIKGNPPINPPGIFAGWYTPRCDISSTGVPSGEFSRQTYAKAHAKLLDKMYGPTSELGVSIAEGREALAAIADRCSRLGRAYTNLKRGRFRAFLKEIGGRPKEKHKKTVFTRPKDASSLWLEYWFGWAPLVGDIYASTEVLSDPLMIPPLKLSAWSGMQLDVSARSVNTYWGAQIGSGILDHMLGLGCEARITNPNAFLAQRMGLTNPLGIAWAVVPFSWLVGWFGNLDQFIRSWTGNDFNGVTYSNAWVSTRVTGSTLEAGRTQYIGHPLEARWNLHVDVVLHRRATVSNFAKVPLIIQGPKLNPTRAATAVSLLLSIFTKG